MTANPWARAWETVLRTLIGDDAVLLAGHNDLLAGGLTHLDLSSGYATATVTERHGSTPWQPAITLPILTGPQITTALTASSTCPHAKALGAGSLPNCLIDPEHTAGIALAPQLATVTLSCDCQRPPCRHLATLAHAVTRLLDDNPAAFTALRDLPATPPTAQRQPAPAPAPVVTRTPPADKTYIPAHQAWQWYRDPDTPTLITLLTDHTPCFPESPAPQPLPFELPPRPAPRSDYIHALVADAAAQATAYLLTGTELACAAADDAARLTAVLPAVAPPEIAERLGLDIADLRKLLPIGAPVSDAAPRAHALPRQLA